jgi:hypothetical protein
MLCETCLLMFRNFADNTANGSRRQNHHPSITSLSAAAKNGCYICFRVFEDLRDAVAEHDAQHTDDQEPLLMWSAHGSESSDTQSPSLKIIRSPKIDTLDSWFFWAIPATHREDFFGFEFSGGKDAIQVRHRLYETIASTTGSPSVGELAKNWYRQCRQNHVACRRPTASRKWYPPRLLDVRTLPTKVVLREDVPYGSEFAALSHCWGRERFLTLNRDLLADFRLKGIPHDALPENFRNAIAACRALDIPYIWIDSLCIFQSGDGSYEDWAEHVKIMGRVYAESDVCVSTAAAAGATQSCLRERDVRLIEPAVVNLYSEPHILVAFDHPTRGFRDTPIASRAWCFQERLLPKRILTYGQQGIRWECIESEELNVCETFPSGVEARCSARGPFALPPFSVATTPDPKTYQDWIKLIELYSECQLTRADEDKFAAFSGIAEHMQNVFNGSPYIAGFFAFELPISLLWHVRHSTQPTNRPAQDCLLYRAPTWSWAAADAPVKCYNLSFAMITGPIAKYASLIDHVVRLKEPDNPFSQLLWAGISLCAPLLSLRWQKGQIINGHQGTLYRVSALNYTDIASFHFDSLEDSEVSQEGVSFMPIHGDHCVTSGLIVRLVPPGHQIYRRTQDEGEEEQECEPTWRRIGMADMYDENISDHVRSTPKQSMLLI